MKKLTFVLINSILDFKIENDEVELVRCSGNDDLIEVINNANGKYIAFVCNNDILAPDYFDYVCAKVEEEFDSCFINFDVDYGISKKTLHSDTEHDMSRLKPYYLEYLWNFIFRKEIFLKILEIPRDGGFDQQIDNLIVNSAFIPNIIYHHIPNSTKNNLISVPYVDYKLVEYYKNIIYIRDNLSGIFNGILTWGLHIIKLFGKKYDLTVIYDNALQETVDLFSKYARTIHREKYVNYICDRYISTYMDYDTPHNFFCKEECSTFIHGIMFEGDGLYPDLYDRYFGVSKTCCDSIRFAFESDKKKEYIHNPLYFKREDIKPHLKLVSTLRGEKGKGIDRLEQVSKILDEEGIPYTWNVFTDLNEGTNHSGFIYRNPVFDIMPYVKDADYLVLLSDIESYSYSVVEALFSNTKVVVTPVEVFNEIGVKDNENAIVIPFHYFEEKNKFLLREKVMKMYVEKDKKIKYESHMNYMEEFPKLFKE